MAWICATVRRFERGGVRSWPVARALAVEAEAREVRTEELARSELARAVRPVEAGAAPTCTFRVRVGFQ